MYVEWKEEYNVGVARFDESHKELYSLINELHAGVVEGRYRDTQKNVLKNLVHYSISHFADEERLMKEYNYPELASHKREHDQFRKKLEEFVDAYMEGFALLTTDLLDYMVRWLEKHVTVTDKKYEPYFRDL
ncbi:MAG: hemerythrin family protein [Nitrospinae bacterium]|nr:hemerythrin family protein [Nitrospinota bacterium]MBF0635417.1 hemerythrin family protein [Nitrospinota bacterium]